MFKGFSRRTGSIDVSDSDSSGKENNKSSIVASAKNVQARTAVFQDLDRNRTPKPIMTKGSRHDQQSCGSTSTEMVQAFDRLLDDLQIPDTLRPKLNGMDSNVKAAMLRSSHAIKSAPTTKPITPKKSNGNLRKAKSSDSLASPHRQPELSVDIKPAPMTAGRFLGAAMRSSVSLGRHSDDELPTSPSLPKANRHSRGISLDLSKNGPGPFSAKNDQNIAKSSKTWTKDMAPFRYTGILTSTSSLELDIEVVKKLRLLLRNESASWTESFLQLRGYSALLTRLNELLEVEWREEQHDDQLLHELLRCFKALSTSSIGCSALRSASPAPYAQLVRLLYSDKKPGDVATRQLIVDLLLILFDLYPPSSLPSPMSPETPRRREVWEETDESCYSPIHENPRLITIPPPHRTIFSFIRSLLLTKAPPAAEAPEVPITPHEFIESLHVQRIYKTYLQELSDICRDYFWVFCHPNNTIWNLPDTDVGRVEKPRAPGGMTGGVEFEAMSYLTSHLKLVNAIAKSASSLNLPEDHEFSAHRFHCDLFASGMERIIQIARKASTTYYPTLHLELSRYVFQALHDRFELPWTLSRTIGAPPSSMVKPGREAKERERKRSSAVPNSPRRIKNAPSTPQRPVAPGVPKVPTPKKLDPIQL